MIFALVYVAIFTNSATEILLLVYYKHVHTMGFRHYRYVAITSVIVTDSSKKKSGHL